MDDKNLAAISDYGPAHLLAKSANLKDEEAVAKHQELYGTLLGPGPGSDNVRHYLLAAEILRQAWEAKTEIEMEHIGLLLTRFWEAGPTPTTGGPLGVLQAGLVGKKWQPPALLVDFRRGGVTIRPRTMFDYLCKALLDYHDKLAICERADCPHPYFVKTHGRQRFCSDACVPRQQQKQQWWERNREKFTEKWRKERKAKRQQASATRRKRG